MSTRLILLPAALSLWASCSANTAPGATVDAGIASDTGTDGEAAGPVGTVSAFPGGKSIAVRWTTVVGATSYTISRDGVQIATQTPGYHADFPEKEGNGIIDAAVVAETPYLYDVTAVGPDSTLTHVGSAMTSLSASTTPLPVIMLDSSKAPDLDDWLRNTVSPFLGTWYPKVSDALARPNYLPPHTFSIRLDPTYTGIAYTAGQTIVVSATYARAHPQGLGVYLHEATHVIQGYTNMPAGWITEGMADYARDYVLHDRILKKPGPGATYQTGYNQGSYFLAWIQDNLSPGFVHKVNIAAHNGTYNAAIFVQATGKKINDLWTQMVGAPLPSPIHYVRLANKCVQANNAATNHVVIATCNGANQQGWGAIHNADGTITVQSGDGCIGVTNSGATNGSLIVIYACEDVAAERWTQLPDGSLKNPASGRCLDDPGQSLTDGTQLRLFDCTGGASQLLSLIP